MCCVFASIVPHPFRCVEFGPVGREQEDFNVLAMFLEPFVDLGLLVVRSVILYQVDAMSATVECRK